jgi:hypothetical protein
VSLRLLNADHTELLYSGKRIGRVRYGLQIIHLLVKKIVA